MTWSEVQERIVTAIADVHAGSSPIEVCKCLSMNPKMGKGNDFLVLIVDAKHERLLLTAAKDIASFIAKEQADRKTELQATWKRKLEE